MPAQAGHSAAADSKVLQGRSCAVQSVNTVEQAKHMGRPEPSLLI